MNASKPLTPLLKMLTGGDRRQIGRSNDVVKRVLKKPALFADLFSGLTADDPLVRMRAADAAEKITREKPALLNPHKTALLRLLETTEEQEVAWHAAVMAPRLRLTKKQAARVQDTLESFLEAPSRIQRVMALQGLVDLTAQDSSLLPHVRSLVEDALKIGAPSVRARARHLKAQLDKTAS